MSHAVLIITGLASAPDFAAALERPLSATVEIAPNRKAGLEALRRHCYDVVIVDASIVEAEPDGADLVWKHSGLAVPLEFNFAIGSGVRLAREARAALARRSREESLAMQAATGALESELRSQVTGLLLQSQLALADPALPPSVAERIKTIVELTGSIRRQLEKSAP